MMVHRSYTGVEALLDPDGDSRSQPHPEKSCLHELKGAVRADM